MSEEINQQDIQDALNIVVYVMLEMMKKGDGSEHNYMKVDVVRDATEYSLIVQRRNGESPHDQFLREKTKTDTIAALMDRLDWNRVENASEPMRTTLQSIRAILSVK